MSCIQGCYDQLKYYQQGNKKKIHRDAFLRDNHNIVTTKQNKNETSKTLTTLKTLPTLGFMFQFLFLHTHHVFFLCKYQCTTPLRHSVTTLPLFLNTHTNQITPYLLKTSLRIYLFINSNYISFSFSTLLLFVLLL